MGCLCSERGINRDIKQRRKESSSMHLGMKAAAMRMEEHDRRRSAIDHPSPPGMMFFINASIDRISVPGFVIQCVTL